MDSNNNNEPTKLILRHIIGEGAKWDINPKWEDWEKLNRLPEIKEEANAYDRNREHVTMADTMCLAVQELGNVAGVDSKTAYRIVAYIARRKISHLAIVL